jgi:hypothetical protein
VKIWYTNLVEQVELAKHSKAPESVLIKVKTYPNHHSLRLILTEDAQKQAWTNVTFGRKVLNQST